jgi:hypothetical protein
MERKESAAERLHEELTRMSAPLNYGPVNAAQASETLWQMHEAFATALMRAAVLDDPEVQRRASSLDAAISVLCEFADQEVREAPRDRFGNPDPPPFSWWGVGIAVNDLQAALVAVQLRTEPEPAIFPEAKVVVDSSWDDAASRDLGLTKLNPLLRERLLERSASRRRL